MVQYSENGQGIRYQHGNLARGEQEAGEGDAAPRLLRAVRERVRSAAEGRWPGGDYAFRKT